MDPALLYLGLVIVALIVFAVGTAFHPTNTRVCPGCGRDVATTARRCRHCGWRAR